MTYVAALDGLRALAILGVFVFHALPGTLKGGFTGVDVFFVLSGYLITSLIVGDLRNECFSLREFYLRRIQRLLPNAVLVIVFTLALSHVALLPSNGAKMAEHGLWTLFNLSNIYIWRNVGGYWGDAADSVPLLHTWSLAVEEQFYLVLPVTLLLLARRTRLFMPVVCLAVASFVLGLYETWKHPIAAFYLLPMRAWELLIGAALAIFTVPKRRDEPVRSFGSSRLRDYLGWIGLSMVTAGFFLISEKQRFPGVIALVPTLGTLGILVSVMDGKGSLARLLSNSLAVFVGRRSYSLYLWHWPLIVIGREYASYTGRAPQAGALVGAAASIVLALIAYWTVESPLRQRGPGSRIRLATLGIGFSICAAAGMAMASRDTTADPFQIFDRPTFSGAFYNVGARAGEQTAASIRNADVLSPRPTRVPPDVWASGGIVQRWGDGLPRVVVLGSSHALMYGKLIDDICRQLSLSVAFFSADATPVFFPTRANDRFPTPTLAQSFDAARRKWVSEWKPDAVILIERWDAYSAKGQLNERLRALVAELAPHTRKIVAFSQIPVLRLGENVNLREYAIWHLKTMGTLPTIAPDSKEGVRRASIATIEAIARDFPAVELVRLDPPFYDEEGSVRYASGRKFYYIDDDHLSDVGAEVVRDLALQAIRSATAR